VRALREMTGSTSGGSEGGVMLVDSGDSENRGSFFIFFRNLLGDGHKKIFFFKLVAREIFVITVITKAFELAFSHFSPGQFLDL
jgi:hypothetical protein